MNIILIKPLIMMIIKLFIMILLDIYERPVASVLDTELRKR